MDAPERIWAWTGRDNARRWHSAPTSRDCTEFIRADLCADPALLAEAVEVLRAFCASYRVWMMQRDGTSAEENCFIQMHRDRNAAEDFLAKLENRHDR